MSKSKQALWVLLGSLSAFIFSILSSAILSRYLSKADYGTYKQVLYVYNSLIIVFTLGLPKTYSYFLPRLDISEAKGAIKKINSLLLLSGLCMSMFLFFASETIAYALKNEALSGPLKYFSIVPLFLLPTLGLQGILSTYKNTKLLAGYSILTNVLSLILVLTPVVLFNGGVTSAIAGFAIASIISFILSELVRYQPLKGLKQKPTDLSYHELFSYSIPLLLAGLWGVLIRSSDQFFISRYFGAEVFADFANGSLQLPFVTMIITATSVILAPIYSKYAFENNNNAKAEITKLWNSAFAKTIMLTYPLLIFFIAFSHEIMAWIYGIKYVDSGDFFQIKLLVNFFTVITYGPLIVSVGGHKFYYRVHMYGAIVLILLQYLCLYVIEEPIAIVWISVICEISRILVMMLYISKYLDLKVYQMIPWSVILKILPALLAVYLIKFLALNNQFMNTNLLVLICTSGFLYAGLFLFWSKLCNLDYTFVFDTLLKKKI